MPRGDVPLRPRTTSAVGSRARKNEDRGRRGAPMRSPLDAFREAENTANRRESELAGGELDELCRRLDLLCRSEERSVESDYRRRLQVLDIARRKRIERQAAARAWISIAYRAIGVMAAAAALVAGMGVADVHAALQALLRWLGGQ